MERGDEEGGLVVTEICFSLIDLPKIRPVILGPSAWIQHTPFAYWLIKVLKPSVFVELGTHYGVSYFSFCQSVKDNKLSTKCYAVDTWEGDPHAGFYGEEVFQKVNEYNKNHFSSFSSLLRMSFDEAVSYFEDKSIDLLHIDGYHTYEAVKHDFETWLPKLAPGAIVLFHDTNVRERDFGVWKFWEELKKSYKLHFEFFHGYGLGVLQISENEKSFILEFLINNAHSVRNYFSSLGNLIEKVEDELVRVRGELEAERNEKAEIQAKLTQVEDELVRVYLSKSWRITRPLRWLRRKLRI